jgi:hypothetical protein
VIAHGEGGWPRPLGLEEDRGHPVPYLKRSAVVVGVVAAAGAAAATAGAGRVDALLDDAAFFAPFAPHFHPVLGRPSTPAEWNLRLMFSSSGTGWAMRACARRSAIRSPGGGSAGSAWTGRCRTDDADEADHPVREQAWPG